jgi:hypothetical protein
VRACSATIHVYAGWADEPFCLCGARRNGAYRRRWWEKLMGLPRRAPLLDRCDRGPNRPA